MYIYIYITDGNHIVLIHIAIWGSTVPQTTCPPVARGPQAAHYCYKLTCGFRTAIFKICVIFYSGIVKVSYFLAEVLLLNKYLKTLSNKIYNINTN